MVDSTPVISGSIQTAVVGVGGYAGGELARLLLSHPRLADKPPIFFGREGETFGPTTLLEQLHPQLARSLGRSLPVLRPFHWDIARDSKIDVVFLATPHEFSRAQVPQWVERGVRVIDLSGAWRLRIPANRDVYRFHDHDDAAAERIQATAVYGSPELHRAEVRKADVVANPGCYATSILLALAPLLQAGVVDLNRGIVCDAKSGVSGAGKAATAKTHFMYAADNLSAYSVYGHRHLGELLEQLRLAPSQIQFTPHLLPIPRGILTTNYLHLTRPFSSQQVADCFADFYRDSPMVRLHAPESLPQIQHVTRTNFCDIGFAIDTQHDRITIVSSLDNLLKGASGQAIQNMNLMLGWREEEGLS